MVIESGFNDPIESLDREVPMMTREGSVKDVLLIYKFCLCVCACVCVLN